MSEETLVQVDISKISTKQCGEMDRWMSEFKQEKLVRLVNHDVASGIVNTYFVNPEDAVLFRLTFSIS
jgi:hypothetical protein